MTIICCVCQKTKNKERWESAAHVHTHNLSHGYCPNCFKRLMKKLAAHTGSSKLQNSAITP